MTVAVRILRSCLTAGVLIGLPISLRSSELVTAVSEQAQRGSTNNAELLRTAGPSLDQTTQWLKSNLPILAKEAIQRRADITLRRSILSAQVTACTLTILETSRQESTRYGNLTDRTTYTVALADVDLNSLRESQNGLDISEMKSWTVHIVAMSDRGKPFTFTSPRTPTNHVVLYFAEGEPASRAATALRRVAALCGATLPPSGNWLNPRSTIQNVNAPALPGGKYVKRRKPDDYLEIGPDGAFSVRQNGQILSGTYASTGTTVDFHAGPWSGVAVGADFVDADFAVWERPTPAAAVPAAAAAAPTAPAPGAMVNADIINMATAHLADEVITTSIRQAKTRQFDLAPSGLIALKSAGVSDVVIAAMQASAAPTAAGESKPSPSPDPSSPLGVYVDRADSTTFLELKADGIVQLQYEGKTLMGTYVIRGDTLELKYDNGTPALYLSFKSGTITYPGNHVWEKTSKTPRPAPPGPCSGIESMGIYTNELMSPQMTQGGLYEWLAKIRNNTGVTKIIRFSWIDEYGQQKVSQVQLKGGDIATSRLDLTQKKFIPPVRDLKIVSCQ